MLFAPPGVSPRPPRVFPNSPSGSLSPRNMPTRHGTSGFEGFWSGREMEPSSREPCYVLNAAAWRKPRSWACRARVGTAEQDRERFGSSARRNAGLKVPRPRMPMGQPIRRPTRFTPGVRLYLGKRGDESGFGRSPFWVMLRPCVLSRAFASSPDPESPVRRWTWPRPSPTRDLFQ